MPLMGIYDRFFSNDVEMVKKKRDGGLMKTVCMLCLFHVEV